MSFPVTAFSTATTLGVDTASAWQPKSRGMVYDSCRRKGAADAPFLVFTAGRSRTAWLSAFLSYGQHKCYNEVAATFAGMNEVISFFNRGSIGSAETGAAQAWRLIKHFIPSVRFVVVTRSEDDIIASFARYEISKIARVDEVKLRKTVAYTIRCLNQITEAKGTLTVRFEDLENEDACRKVFEHCLPYEFDPKWWRKMNATNVQSNAAALVEYYQANLERVSAFKATLKQDLRILVRCGDLAHAVR